MIKKTSTIMLGIICVLMLFITGCPNHEDNGNNNQSGNHEFETITISSDGSFDPEDCKNRGLNDKVMMLESKYCGHCKATMPVFMEACSEKGVEPLVLDLSVDKQREQMESFGINIQFTPVFVFGCNYYVGVHSKGDYLKYLDKFLSSQN